MQSAKAFTITAHGAQMPAIGFGTMELPHRPAELVAAAIAAGYRHIDTARKYGTEERVGEGIRASGIPRNELFVTTKVTEENAREADFLHSVETSLKALNLALDNGGGAFGFLFAIRNYGGFGYSARLFSCILL